ncbi:AAA domain-containing protein [Rhodococcoides fascians A21d2]|uniref:AAA family ATPase n=1 Tax=Rhodococcoides fascians TaxID=1828 RepID=UPI000689238E|nr:AAA family ATPase [Rhodococcus fascians]QII02057.1 AAA domain-containing protein [Rhodococcus fascians A21d2]
MELTDAVDQGLHVRTDDRAQAQASQFDAFHRRFPRENWAEMTLEKYALGQPQSKHSYSYALEWGTPTLGSIRGGSAKKHRIFLHKSGSWVYPKGFTSVNEAWDALHASFLKLLNAGDDGRWRDTSAIEQLRTVNTVRLKTLYLYFPEQVLPVYSPPHLKYFAERLHIDHKGDALSLNQRVLAALRETDGLEQASSLDLGTFLYAWSRPPGWHTPSSWRVTVDAAQWESNLATNRVSVGWDEVGDLSLFETQSELKQAFRESYSGTGAKLGRLDRQAKHLWWFREMAAGDQVVATSGPSDVLALGTVQESEYEWDYEASHHKHTVGVEWNTSAATSTDSADQSWLDDTISALTAKQFRAIFKAKSPSVASPPNGDVDDADPLDPDQLRQFEQWQRVLERKKQLIFYGPPGTGKTWTAKRFARWLLDEQFERTGTIDEARTDNLTGGFLTDSAWWIIADSWDDLFADGRYIATLPFKASAGPNAGDVALVFDRRQSRVFGLARVVNFYGKNNNAKTVALKPIKPLPCGPHISKVQADTELAGLDVTDGLRMSAIRRLAPDAFRRLLHLSGAQDVYLEHRADDLANYLTEVTFHASYAYEEFIEGYRPVSSDAESISLQLKDGVIKRVASTAHAEPDMPFVLLIDEINRANVPRVFGELITVIEADKRGSSVVLPASGDRLIVPENLMIIGTMNTSDRSIRSLDAALRRRFAFIELLPDSSILANSKIGDLPLDMFLDELNKTITELAGRERQIGHSFFLDEGDPIDTVEQFAEVLRLEIIPLLQEIAFDDFAKLKEYLGGQVVDSKRRTLHDIVSDDDNLVDAVSSFYLDKP